MEFSEKYGVTPGEKNKEGKDKIIISTDAFANIEMLDSLIKQIEKNRLTQ